jgi:hypothetical protein
MAGGNIWLNFSTAKLVPKKLEAQEIQYCPILPSL